VTGHRKWDDVKAEHAARDREAAIQMIAEVLRDCDVTEAVMGPRILHPIYMKRATAVYDAMESTVGPPGWRDMMRALSEELLHTRRDTAAQIVNAIFDKQPPAGQSDEFLRGYAACKIAVTRLARDIGGYGA
jgi:hypothetical protein